jgi:hypothetical protein
MHTLRLKHISHEFHYPDIHESVMQIHHALSSEFFWAVFALFVLMGILIMIATFAGADAIVYPEALPDIPFLPLHPFYA